MEMEAGAVVGDPHPPSVHVHMAAGLPEYQLGPLLTPVVQHSTVKFELELRLDVTRLAVPQPLEVEVDLRRHGRQHQVLLLFGMYAQRR